MELITKRPEGKPPFVGLLFETEKQALITQHLVTLHKENSFTLTLYPLEKYGQLFRIPIGKSPTDPGATLNILNLKIDVQGLYEFLEHSASCEYYNYGHVIGDTDRHEIARVKGKPFVLRVVSVEIVFSGGYERDTFRKKYPNRK
jgi:hypothetical protein